MSDRQGRSIARPLVLGRWDAHPSANGVDKRAERRRHLALRVFGDTAA
jgi:hypothetical protein